MFGPGDFATADHHWGHNGVIKHANRPFSSVEEMDRELIDRWNAVVPKKAVVYHMGDLSFHKAKRTIEIIQQLNGRIRLVLGNHDRVLKKLDVALKFDWVKDYYETKTPDGTKVVMCHYAFEVWNKHHYGAIHLHGHSHGTLPHRNRKRIDVGIDTHPGLAPYSYSEVMEIAAQRGFAPVDHHQSRPNQEKKS